MKNIVPHIDGRGCPHQSARTVQTAPIAKTPTLSVTEALIAAVTSVNDERGPPLGARALTVAQYVANAPAIRVTARIMQLLAET